jgi:hypothetical protein
MTKKISSLVILIVLIANTSFSQEKNKRQIRKELKEKENIAQEQKTSKLLESKNFIFKAKTASPMGGKSINLTSNYFVQFEPNLIDSHLPFFGRATSAPYGVGDSGLTFKGEPQQFITKKGEKNYIVNAVVKENNETYNLMLTVGFRGSALLIVNTNNRSTMSFNGDIIELEKKD